MAYSKAELKSNGNRASPGFKPFLIGNTSDKCMNADSAIRFNQIHQDASMRFETPSYALFDL